jgi:hypothetical protein
MLERDDAGYRPGRAMVPPPHAAAAAPAGRLDALAPRAPPRGRTAAPPREGKRLEVLIDGANALPQSGAGDRGRAPRASARGTCSRTSRPVRGGRAGAQELPAEAAERVPVRVLVGRRGAGVRRRGDAERARERSWRG